MAFINKTDWMKTPFIGHAFINFYNGYPEQILSREMQLCVYNALKLNHVISFHNIPITIYKTGIHSWTILTGSKDRSFHKSGPIKEKLFLPSSSVILGKWSLLFWRVLRRAIFSRNRSLSWQYWASPVARTLWPVVCTARQYPAFCFHCQTNGLPSGRRTSDRTAWARTQTGWWCSVIYEVALKIPSPYAG